MNHEVLLEDDGEVWSRVEVVVGTIVCLGREDQNGKFDMVFVHTEFGLVSVELVNRKGERAFTVLGSDYETALVQAKRLSEHFGIPLVDGSQKGGMQ